MTDIEFFLEKIKVFPLLTREKERAILELVKSAQGGITKKEKEELRDFFLSCNLRLVVYIAKSYFKRLSHNLKLDFIDLIQYGHEGLCIALERFDLSRGCKFSTYATWWIKQSIKSGIQNGNRTVRIPSVFSEKCRLAFKILSQKKRRAPDATELAEYLKVPVSQTMMFLCQGFSIDAPRRGDSDDFGGAGSLSLDKNTPNPQNVFDEEEREVLLFKAMAILTPQEREIIQLRFGVGKKKKQMQRTGDIDGIILEELGTKFGLTRERIRQIQAKAQRKLLQFFDERGVTFDSLF